MTVFPYWFWTIFTLCTYLPALSSSQLPFVSAESDPDAFIRLLSKYALMWKMALSGIFFVKFFDHMYTYALKIFQKTCAKSAHFSHESLFRKKSIQNCVNVINGDYCESATDLVISGPDALVLQRFYSTQDAITGVQAGGWRIFPQRFLVVGKEVSRKACNVGKDRFEWTCAFTGERSGAILPYSGWRNTNGWTKDPLKIDMFHHAIGCVNTYAQEINGQTNHQNNLLYCKGDTCQLTLGDGTRRIYQSVEGLPSRVLGEELTPSMASQVIDPSYFLLTKEVLPSGNQLFFSYDHAHHLIAVEMKNSSGKFLSWIHLSYEFAKNTSQVHITTSDERELTYFFVGGQLTQISGSHSIPVTYEYDGGFVVKKILPEGRFVEIAYQEGKVQTLKGPHAQSGKAQTVHTFSYGKGYTDVFDAMGVKTRYLYDLRSQLIAIEREDHLGQLYRTEQKFWGRTKSDAGLLFAKTMGDGNGRIYSYRSFMYDKSGNVIEERLYGNLTGKQEVALHISPDGKLLNAEEAECHVKTFGYSTDGYNLLTQMGDCKGNQIRYTYKEGTNLLIRKLIYDKGSIKKRTFESYNEDGVCIRVMEDDDSQEEESPRCGWSLTERHIKEMQPKAALPGVGLREVIQEKAFDLKTKTEILIKKQVNTYDAQSNLLSCDTYDANGEYVCTEKRTYTHLGKIASYTDAVGKKVLYTYDGVGNEISCLIPFENRSISSTYDFHNLLIQRVENNTDESITLHYSYDVLGRKIATTDRYGQTTHYEYDSFHRLTKVIHPEVFGEHGETMRPTFEYEYDIFGNVLRFTDAKGFITTKWYNLRGDPTKISYPDGSSELFKYDPEGSLHRSLTREQIITVYEYDYLGRPIYEESSTSGETGVCGFLRSKSYKYNGFRCAYEKDYDLITCYSFDPAGRVVSRTQYGSGEDAKSPDARVTEYLYDALGRIEQKKVWFDIGAQDYALESYSYDLLGNMTQKRIEDATNATLLHKHYAYNLHGQCEEEYILDHGIHTTLLKTKYNSQGEAISYMNGLGEETKILIDPRHCNALGQTVLKKTLINALGVHTEMEFDALGRLYSLSKKDPSGLLLSGQQYLYDALGNQVVEIHDQIIDGKIVDAQRTEWIYGPMGRLEEETQAAGSPLSKTIHYEYNTLGKLIRKNLSGTCIHYTYSKDGNLHKIESFPRKQELQISNCYSYDRQGNITSASSLEGKSVQKTYTPFHQVRKETIHDGEGVYTLEYSYDRKGRLKTILLPDRSKIVYIYDALFGREVQRITPEGDILYTHTYDSYDLQGNLISESHIGYAGSQEHTYNLNGQKIATKSDFYHEEYVRDVLGRVTEVQGEKPEHYVYNTLSQIIFENKNTHSYDSLDNRMQSNHDALVYNALNQCICDAKTEYSYDAQGNLLRKVLDGEETRFESNILSQLTTIEKTDQTALTFSYDPFGRLLVEKHLEVHEQHKKTLGTTRYLYLGYQEIGTLTSTGSIETLKIPGIHGDELSSKSVAFEIKGETYLPLHDMAGNVVRLIDAYNREVIESYAYTVFGQVSIFNAEGTQENTSFVSNPWQFAEKRIDDKSGLILFGLRFYDPSMGRWIGQDLAKLLDGPNLYAYLHNNPLNHFDRFGLATESNSENPFEKYLYGEVEPHCYCETHRTCKRGGDIGTTAISHLPKVRYDDTFEKYYKDYRSEDLFIKDCYDDSTCYNLDGVSSVFHDLGIGFINGIWNHRKGAQEGAQYVSRLAGGYHVHAVYNATHGDMDLPECFMGLHYIATEPVRQLHNMWNSFFEKTSANSKFLMICHSQGAIHVRNALLDYPPELRERILVAAIAPAAYIYKETCAKLIHYRAQWWRDGVPRLDRAGAKREKDTVVTLTSHPDASGFDHEFMSPTYQEKLQEHIRYYIQSQGEQL